MTLTSEEAWSIVAVAAVAYPLSALATGLPRFPSASECVFPAPAATPGSQLEVSFGRFDTYAEAVRLQKQVRRDGFQVLA